MIESYLRANNMFVDYNEVCIICLLYAVLLVLCFVTILPGMLFAIQPQQERVYSSYLELDLSEVVPCISGPKR